MKFKTKILQIIGTPVLALIINTSTALAGGGCEGGDAKACLSSGKAAGIMDKIMLIVNMLSAMVFVVAAIMLVLAGVQYMASNGNPQAVADAKKKIYAVFIGIVAFLLLWAFLQWLIPGGLWSGSGGGSTPTTPTTP